MIAATHEGASGAWLGGTLRRLAACVVVLLPLCLLAAEVLVSAALPAMGAVFKCVAGDFKLLALAIDQEGADRVVRATVAWKDVVVFDGHAVSPDPRGLANASTLLAHGLQSPITALLATLAWPPARGRMPWCELVRRCLLLVPAIGVLVATDIPLVLAGELQALAADALLPGATAPLATWARFLGGGGRYALGLVTAMLVVRVGRCPALSSDRLSGTKSSRKPGIRGR